MATANIPTVFVSSTCYDLKQIRANIREFIEAYGFSSMLSDFDPFPVDPDIGTVENCLRAVDAYANIFVLVVGGRYGSPTDTGKSVTNLEYLRGRAKGIPVYAFVQRSILDILPVWKANPDGNFESVVDSPKLFEFVKALRDSGEVWVFPFDIAQDITRTLRNQWAYLFMDSLQLRLRARLAALPQSLSALQGRALRLVIEQPLLWESRLFYQVLLDELRIAKPLRHDLNYGILFGKSSYIPGLEIINWLPRKMNEATRISRALTRLINVALKDAMRPDGVPANAEEIVYVASRVAAAYRNIIEWTMDIFRIQCDTEFEKVVKLTANFGTHILKELEEQIERSYKELEDAVNAPRVPGERRVIECKFVLTSPDLTEFDQELERLSSRFG